MEQQSNCPLKDTKYCRMLNQPGCARCCLPEHPDYVRICEELDQLETLLPEGGVEDLFIEKDCAFCHRRKHHGYAILYMANPQIEDFMRDVMGKKKLKGAVIPLQFGICDTCRARFAYLSKLPQVVPLVLGAAGLVVLYATSLPDRVAGVGIPVTLLVLGGIVLLSRLVCLWIRKSLFNRYASEMCVDIMDHPKVKEMTEKGWVILKEGSCGGLRFSTSRLTRGIGTGEPEETDKKFFSET